jgi:hypothetical protein
MIFSNQPPCPYQNLFSIESIGACALLWSRRANPPKMDGPPGGVRTMSRLGREPISTTDRFWRKADVGRNARLARAISRSAARFGQQINTDEFSAHRRRPRRRPVAQGRAMSNGCTFSPPAIRGFDGSKRSRTSRFLTSECATTKASFRLLACRSATLKKALPK